MPTKEQEKDTLLELAQQKVKDEDILKNIKGKLVSAQASHDELKDRSETNWKIFSGEGYDTLHIPTVYARCRQQLARFVTTVLATKPIYALNARHEKDQKITLIRQKIFNFELYEIPYYVSTLVSQLLQQIVDGSTWLKAGYDYKRKGLSYPFIRNKDIWFDPFALTPAELGWVIQRCYRTKDYLNWTAKQDIYRNIDEFLKKADEKKKGAEVSGQKTNLYDIREVCTPDKLLTVGMCGGEPITVLRAMEDNPYKRIIYEISRYDINLTKLTGFGIPQILEHLSEEEDTIRQQRITAVTRAIIGLWAYMPSALSELAVDRLKTGEAGGFQVDSFDTKPQRLDDRNVPISSFTEEAIMREDMDDASGVPRYSRGLQPQRQETKGGIAMLQAKGTEGQNSHLLLMNEAFVGIGRLMLKIMNKFMKNKKYDNLLAEGEQALWQKKKLYDTNDEIILKTALTDDQKQINLMGLNLIGQKVKEIPGALQYVDVGEYMELLAETTDPKIAGRVIKTEETEMLDNAFKQMPPEVKQEALQDIAEKIKARMAAQAQGGGGQGLPGEGGL